MSKRMLLSYPESLYVVILPNMQSLLLLDPSFPFKHVQWRNKSVLLTCQYQAATGKAEAVMNFLTSHPKETKQSTNPYKTLLLLSCFKIKCSVWTTFAMLPVWKKGKKRQHAETKSMIKTVLLTDLSALPKPKILYTQVPRISHL